MKRKKVRMVELKTTIAQGLHVTDDSAGYDAACKRVLSEKAILARIMKSCLEEYKDCDVNDIAEKYIEGQPPGVRRPGAAGRGWHSHQRHGHRGQIGARGDSHL